MIIDLNDIDLIKGISRTEAKAVHKDLPPGGAWRTIKGHHIYIKDGKVLAGSIPGVTKAKKATKAQLAAHQATIDGEAKQGTKKDGKKTDAKGKGTGKASKSAGPKSGSDSKGTSGKKKTKASGSGKKAGEVDAVPSKPKKAPTGKKSGTTGKSTPSQSAPAKPAVKAAKSGAKKAEVTSKGKANETTKVGAKTNGKAKADKPTAKSSRTGKPIPTRGAKTGTSEDNTKNQSATTAGRGVDSTLKKLASTATDGMDMWANAHENPEHLKALKDKLKTMSGSTMEKLDALHKEYGGGSDVPEYVPANTKGITDFTLGEPKFKPDDVKLTVGDNHAEASAHDGGKVIFRKDMLKHPMETQRHVMTHEIGHVLSNAHPELEKHIMSNPQDALGRTNQKKGRFEGVSYTPEESWAESFARYHTEPEFFKQKYPKAYDFVDKVLPKIPNYKDYLKAGLDALDKANGITSKADPLEEQAKKLATESKDVYDFINKLQENPEVKKFAQDEMSKQGILVPDLYNDYKNGEKARIETEAVPDTHVEVYHGTRLPNVEEIRKSGFKLNGTEDDFGDAAYFKSPSFDDKDHEDWVSWLKMRKEKGYPIPAGYAQRRGNDTQKIVNGFSKGKEPAVIRAFIPKEHILDCTNGRPKELATIIDEFEENDNTPGRKRLLLKHLAGIELDPKTSYNELEKHFEEHRESMKQKWGGGKFIPNKISPYELYAKKTGVKAIVDKLNAYQDEGWQIGVYDPSVIQLKEHGSGIRYNNTKKAAELIKALMKALAKGAIPYCLIHHEIDDKGLHLHLGASKGDTMEKTLYIDLEKAITRTQAKAVHKELPPGGEWRTMNGHHIYIKDGKILAGSVPGATKAKKATKAQLAEHQATIDKEKKASKKVPAPKKKAEPKAKVPAPKKKVEPKAKVPAPKKKAPARKEPQPPAKKEVPKKAPAKKAPAKKATPKKVAPKDIRSDAQKNRELAYDVGDKVGGARKDEFIASFKEKPTAKNLEELEKMSGAIAEKMVTKANLLPKFDFQQEHDNGSDLPTAILKKLLFDRIAPKPEPSNPETRKAYMVAMSKIHRHFAGIKSFENMRDALREVSVMARQAKAGEEAENALARYEANPERWSYFNGDVYKERAKVGKEAAKFMDFHALGDKFHNILTNYESLNRSIDTVRKNTQEGWEKYLTPQAKAAPKKKGEENKRWEREAVAEHLRKGGKETKVKKPEDLMQEFNLRGVEFGNWVNDSSGLYHLKRSAEAFDDLSDIIGIDKKDISLNGRLAIAFGARGKGGALAHYEPDRKVINMTKYGGAGSLAHEWGHAMDNILYQYSNGGQEALGLASQGQMGSHDPTLKALYDNLMDAITKPAPGETGGSIQMLLDSEVKQLTRYYPEMRRQINSDMKPEDVYNHWAKTINEKTDRAIASIKLNQRGFYKTPQEQDKAFKKYESQRKRELTDIGHYMAHELRLRQNGGKYGGDHYKGHIEISTGKSEYMTRMEENQPGKTQNGVHYWSAPEEMFARVFESYVQEKMKKSKRENNYLVHGTSEGAVKAAGAPFPIGKERQHMFKAMENLLKYVGSKGTLKKALILELLASGSGDMTDLWKSFTSPSREDMLAYFKDKLEDGESVDGAYEETIEAFDRDYGEEMDFRSYLKKNGYKVQDHFWVNKSLGYTKRSAYSVANPEDVIYIPLNRLRTVYQTEKATNWDKVQSNYDRMMVGEHLEPVSIGFDYDVHDGHHRIEAAKKCGHEHIPCIVKGGNDIERERAIEAYREIWKSIEPDPTEPDMPGHVPIMYRGVGLRELRNIQKTGFIQSKGKGNDEDKGTETCFSNLYSQAEGYARSNYDLYNERQAFVLIVRNLGYAQEDEHGEMIASIPVPKDEIMEVVFIPKPDIM
jgi:hypothetical protein